MKNIIGCLCRRHTTLSLLVLISFLLPAISRGQSTGSIYLTPHGVFDHVYDGRGGSYMLSDLSIGQDRLGSGTVQVISATCQAGYFTLHFDQASTFFHGNVPAQQVACQVFSDVSALITSSAAPGSINIHCIDEWSAGAIGYQYYVFPSSPTFSNQGYIDGQIQKALLSGTDPYANLPISFFNSGQFYHGGLGVNPNGNWSYSLTTVSIGSTEHDLYTVILHEVMHALGFLSLIDLSGKSKFTFWNAANNYFGRYDKFLRDNAGNPLLAPSNTLCPNANITFAATSNSVLAAGMSYSTSAQLQTLCSVAAQYVGATTAIVHTPHGFNVSSLSHFEDMCSGTYAGTCTPSPLSPGFNDLYYLMSDFSGQGPCYVKRYPRDEERLVLCDLGYSVQSVYGTTVSGSNYSYSAGPCNPVTVYGQNDGLNVNVYTYTTTTGNYVGTHLGLLSNDSPSMGLSVSCLDVVTNATLAQVGTSFTVTAQSGSGLHILKYYPKDAIGNTGNATYVFVYFLPPGCTAGSTCNFVNNGGFEAVQGGGGCGLIAVNNSLYLDCWDFYNNGQFPSVLSTNCQNPLYQLPGVHSSVVTTVSVGSVNNRVLNVWKANGSPATVAKTYLNSPLVNGTVYQASLRVLNHGAHTTSSINVNSANNAVVLSLATHTISAFTPTLSFPAGLYSIGNVTIAPGFSWSHVTFTFMYTPAVQANVLLVGIDAALTSTTSSLYDVLIDEVSITTYTPVLTLSTSTLCSTEGLTDLAQYTVFPGTFSGPLTISSVGQIDFNVPALLSPGYYAIGYTYSTNTCMQTNYHGIELVNCCASPSVTAFTASSVSSNTAIGGPVNIANSFTVQNGASMWLNGEFMVASNVSITVASGSTLHLWGAHLYSCSDLWNGIVVQDGGVVQSLENNGTSNLIEDAFIGIRIHNYTSTNSLILDLNSTIFNKNYIGIEVKDYNHSSTSLENVFSLRQCVFTCRTFSFTSTVWPSASASSAGLRDAPNGTAGLNAPYPLLGAPNVCLRFPHVNQGSYIGIHLENVGVTGTEFYGIRLGSATSHTYFNVFDSQLYGIHAENSNVYMENNVFQNSKHKSDYPNVSTFPFGTGGAGIYHANGLFNGCLTMTSSATSLSTRFYDCHRAVEAHNLWQFDASKCITRSTQSINISTFGPGAAGFYLSTNRFRYYIRDCEFTNINKCINVGVLSGPYMTVATGTTLNNGVYASFLGVKNCNFSPGTGFLNYLNRAVEVTSANNFTPIVQTNTNVTPPTAGIFIQQNSLQDVYRGIDISGVTGLQTEIHDNHIDLALDNYLSPEQFAIKISNHTRVGSYYTSAYLNTATGSGTSNPSESLFNITMNAGAGSPSITCNELSNSHTGFLFEGSSAGSVWAGNLMQPLVNGLKLFNNGIMGPQGTTATASSNDWQGTWTNGVNLGTYVSAGNSTLNIAGSSASASPLYVNSSQVPLNNGGSAFTIDQYGTNNYLFQTDLASYQCSGIPNNIILHIPDPESYDLISHYSTDELLLYRYLRFDSELMDEDGVYSDFYTGELREKVAAFMDIEEAAYYGDYSMMRDRMNGISFDSENQFDRAYERLYTVWANLLDSLGGNGQISDSDLGELLSVAQLCAGTNGPAIYQARALYNSLVADQYEFYGCPDIPNQRRRKPSIAVAKHHDAVRVYPSPTQGEVYIEIPSEEDEIKLAIYDMAGACRLQTTISVKGFSGTVSMPSAPGVYMLVGYSKKHGSFSKKVVVAR